MRIGKRLIVTKNYMSLDEIKEAELNILREFHSFCEKNGMDYFLSGGTLLGAVRHKGFIPWDDDIDVFVSRPDAEKLLKIGKTGISENYVFETWYTDPDSTSTMIKIVDKRTRVELSDVVAPHNYGVWIDVFVADGVPDDPAQNKKDFKKTRFYMDLFAASVTKLGVERRSKFLTMFQYVAAPAIAVAKLIGYRTFIKKMFAVCMKYDYNKCRRAAVYEGRGGMGEILIKKDIYPKILVDFEGEKFYTMSCWDSYLKKLYGDYMQLPPEDKRVSRHGMKVYRV